MKHAAVFISDRLFLGRQLSQVTIRQTSYNCYVTMWQETKESIMKTAMIKLLKLTNSGPWKVII